MKLGNMDEVGGLVPVVCRCDRPLGSRQVQVADVVGFLLEGCWNLEEVNPGCTDK